jgi:hypothetical protein
MKRIPQIEPLLGIEEREEVLGVLDSGFITEGKKTREFEAELAHYLQVPYVVSANNATIALTIALRGLGIEPGDEVIVPDFTFIATANAVSLAGAEPVFADVSRETFAVDLEDAESRITARTRALIPVDLNGRAPDMSTDPRVGAVAGRLTYRQDGVPHGYTESLYLRYEAWLKRLESNLFSSLGADGCLFAIRRELYFPLSRGRGDDFELPVQILLRGYGSILEPEAISCEESSKSVAKEFRRRIRCVAWVSASALMLAREAFHRRRWFVLFQLISHKFLRWFTLLLLLIALLTSAMLQGVFYQTVFALQVGLYSLALLTSVLDRLRIRIPKLLLAPYYFCAIHLAALVGLGQGLNPPGEIHTWEKTR